MDFDKTLNQARKNAEQIQNIATKLKITLPANFPELIVQLNDCLDTYSAVKVLIAAIVNDITNLNGLSGWSDLISHFDNNWDKFAKEYNEIFNRANSQQQTNILESFARDHFGDNIFEAGSIIKNETPNILSGINEFKNAIDVFSGSYRNPVIAANKIKNGVNAIVRSTEKIAKSINNIITYIQGKCGINNAQGLKFLSNLGSITTNRGVAAMMSILNIGASGINAFSDGTTVIDALRHGDYRTALSASQSTYKNIKSIVSEIKNLKDKKGAGMGANPFGKSSTSSSSTSSTNAPTGPAYSYICSKAKIKCTNGDKISTLTVLPSRTIWLYGQPQANISDHVSMVNIAPCGKCHTTAYPPTGAATAANHGKLTPMPCVPNTPFPWMGGKNDVMLKGDPALISTSKLKCIYGGTITITFDGQNV